MLLISGAKIKSNLEGPGSSNYCQNSELSISVVTTLPNQQRSQLNKINEHSVIKAHLGVGHFDQRVMTKVKSW